MIDQTVDIIGTAILFVAPFVLALIVIVLVIAYPWLLLIPLGIWYLVVKYVPDEVSTQVDTGSAAETPSPSPPSSA
jgi:hypothetical protein